MALQTYSLTTTGATAATGIALLSGSGGPLGTLSQFNISCTYGTVTFRFDGTFDGTVYFPVAATLVADASPASGTISPSDNTSYTWNLNTAGMSGVRLYIISIASGTVAVEAQSGSFVGIPLMASSAISTFGNASFTGTITGTSTSASALAVGANGATNPVIKVNANTSSVATGLQVTGAAAAAGLALAVISSGTNENLTIDAKGSGTIDLNATGTGNILTPRSILLRGPTKALGYATGAGGAVTQATDKSTGVTSNTVTTAITLNNANLAAATIVAFTFTNSTIAATDQVVVTHESAGTSAAYTFNAFPGSGSAVISVRNNTAGGLAEAIVLRVSVYKAVSA